SACARAAFATSARRSGRPSSVERRSTTRSGRSSMPSSSGGATASAPRGERAQDGSERSARANAQARRLFGMAIERRETFGEYALLGWLGAGATAHVYRARRDDDELVVAL